MSGFEEYERLQSAADDARDALMEHVKTAVIVWYGPGGPPRKGEPVTVEWLEQYRRLRAERDRAEDAIAAFFDRLR